jgi:hypothetical protein
VSASTAAAPAADPQAFKALRDAYLLQARASFLDKNGKTALPDGAFPPEFSPAFATEIEALRSLGAQAACVEAGRGAEDLTSYAARVVLAASRLGINPPETALAVYRDRVRPADRVLDPRESAGCAELAAAASQPAKTRFVYLTDLIGREAVAAAPALPPVVLKGGKGKKGRKRRRVVVAPPPEPQRAPESVLASIDWSRAEDLAEAAEEGAQGWYSASTRKRARREQRRRRGRCYEWVRMALQETGLWTNEYRAEVPQRGDWRRPRRAFSFAWAMNKLETEEQKDPAAARKAPLQRLDLRVDPLVIGSILVFDRSVCGFNASSGHIEVVSSIEPLRASSYKFHEVKLPCLVAAASTGRLHVYVPRRQDQTN